MIVYVKGNKYELRKGMTYDQLAAQVKDLYEHDICLAFSAGKLRALTSFITDEGEIEFITTADDLGCECYRRSLTFLCLKSFYDVCGKKNVDHIKVMFSVNKGYYLEASGNFELNDALLKKVEDRMREYAAKDAPIERMSIPTTDAVKLFEKENMRDKSRLFEYRRAGLTNVYEIDGFYDYFYGHMLPSCGKLKVFKLFTYMEGFVLQFPAKERPEELSPFVDSPKVYGALLESERWSEKLGTETVRALNDHIVDGTMRDLILIQEANQNQKLSDIATEIKNRGTIKFIMIAGPSSSGKTSFSHRLSIHLRAHGLIPHPIGVDNYFVDRELTPKDEDGNFNFEDLECIDITLFNSNMNDLLSGKEVELPEYNFITGKREYNGDKLKLGENDILVIEGIHCLNARLYPDLPQDRMYKIYISALTQLNVDEHNRIATTDGRLIRRMVRDARTRGNSATQTIAMWNSVRKGEEKNIFPYQESADVVFNSAQVYELSVLKPYAERILFSVKKDAPEYQEAKRLLKFLDYFLTIPADGIPNDSILREFVGGSVFKV